MSWRRLSALKVALRARSKRCMPRASAARKSGVEKGYLLSAVSGSPSTAIGYLPACFSSRGARSLKGASMYSAHMPGGSIWCVSASSTLHPLRIVPVLSSEVRGDGLAKLGGAGATTLIGGQHGSIGIDTRHRRLEVPSGLH